MDIDASRGLHFFGRRPLNAEDVAFSFNLYMDEIDSFLNAATESFAAVEVLDEHVVVIILSEAIPNLDSLLVGLPILPEHVWREHVDAAMELRK